jgi:hypothetical protein
MLDSALIVPLVLSISGLAAIEGVFIPSLKLIFMVVSQAVGSPIKNVFYLPLSVTAIIFPALAVVPPNSSSLQHHPCAMLQ